MHVRISNKNIFSLEVRELLHAFSVANFFEDAVLIGSWVMPLYRDVFGINYVLRTLDIDFAVKFVHAGETERADIEGVLGNLGYIPVITQSGIRKFTRENFTVEFVASRRGGRDGELVSIDKWNITALPLPFVDLLLDFPFTADSGNFTIRAPLPEAFFLHKLITAQRRLGGGKKDKDLEQCSIIVPHLNQGRLEAVVGSLKLSKKTQKGIHASCEAINFPPQSLGLQ